MVLRSRAACAEVSRALVIPPADDDLFSLGKGLRFLYQFSGRLRKGSFKEWCKHYGAEVVCLDVVRPLRVDLLNDEEWHPHLAAIVRGDFDGGLTSPPCSSFAHSLGIDDGLHAPQPLRGEWPPDLYGLKAIRPEDKEKVRIGTALALRGAEFASAFADAGRPWLAETPAQRSGNLRFSNCRNGKLCLIGRRLR